MYFNILHVLAILLILSEIAFCHVNDTLNKSQNVYKKTFLFFIKVQWVK